MTTVHAELTAPDSAGHRQIVLMASGGADADIAVAAKWLQTLTPYFDKSDPPGALLTQATWPAVVQLAATYGPAWAPGPNLRAWIAEESAARLTVSPLTYTAPQGLTPYAWQSDGAQMIAATGRALITDDPGTGKTITAILGLVERAGHTMNPGPALIVCPASVIDAWVEAWRTWAPHVKAVAWRGSPKQRQALSGTADVYVTSYETARNDAPPVKLKGLARLRHLGLTALVIDECHLIKNPTADRSQAVVRLARGVHKLHGTVVALSGTPITHHPGDLCPALEALEPGAYPSSERWINRYCMKVMSADYNEEILGLNPHTEPEFRLTMLGQFRRVSKADVLAELPPKVYSVRTVELPREWRTAYDEFQDQMYAELPDDGGELSVMDVLSVLGHLSRLACSPADVEITHGPDAYEPPSPRAGELKRHVRLELKPKSWKVDALLEVLEERCGPNGGQAVVAFAPSRQLMKLAGDAAQKAGYRVGYVVGGQSAADRTAAVERFQAGQLDLICATTGAGGVGITLTAARTVVFLQRPWSLVESIQAEDRCHRIGSERHDSIEVIDIVAKNTVDTRVRAVLRERAGQLSDLVQDPRIVAELLGGSNVTRTERKSA